MDSFWEPKPHENQKNSINKTIKIMEKKNKKIKNNKKIKASQNNLSKELSKRQKLIKKNEIKKINKHIGKK